MVLKVYISGMSGNKEVKKRQQRVLMILDSKNIKYDVIDITEPDKEAEKDFMQTNATKMGTTGTDPPPTRHPLPPQLFNGDEYCGDYEGFDLANELDTLEQYLKLAPADITNISAAKLELKHENGDENKNKSTENMEVKENGDIEKSHDSDDVINLNNEKSEIKDATNNNKDVEGNTTDNTEQIDIKNEDIEIKIPNEEQSNDEDMKISENESELVDLPQEKVDETKENQEQNDETPENTTNLSTEEIKPEISEDFIADISADKTENIKESINNDDKSETVENVTVNSTDEAESEPTEITSVDNLETKIIENNDSMSETITDENVTVKIDELVLKDDVKETNSKEESDNDSLKIANNNESKLEVIETDFEQKPKEEVNKENASKIEVDGKITEDLDEK